MRPLTMQERRTVNRIKSICAECRALANMKRGAERDPEPNQRLSAEAVIAPARRKS